MNQEPLITPTHEAHWKQLKSLPAQIKPEGLTIGDQYVMFYAENELMQKHAELLCNGKKTCDVLEIGVGLGVFAKAVNQYGVNSYTGVEVHPDIVNLHREFFSTTHKKSEIICGSWQELYSSFGTYDCIMYDTWPPEGYDERDFQKFVEIVCGKCLKPDGRFSFFSNGLPSRAEMETLRKAFNSIQLERYKISELPSNWTLPDDECFICVGYNPRK